MDVMDKEAIDAALMYDALKNAQREVLNSLQDVILRQVALVDRLYRSNNPKLAEESSRLAIFRRTRAELEDEFGREQ